MASTRPQLSDEVAAHVRQLVLSGQLRAGEFVRVDRLARDLEMSITPVREGLLALRGEGLLTLVPRRGFQVATLTEGDVRDIFWVQAQIAGELAARASVALDDEALDELEELQRELGEALAGDDLERVERLNHSFHRRINVASDGSRLRWFLAATTRYVPLRYYHRVGGWPDATRHDHTDVLEALRARDAEGARRAMVEHIVHTGELLVAHGGFAGERADDS